jgi:hypothetical protein
MNTVSPDPSDVFKGSICLDIPAAGMQVALGGTCTSLNQCADNLTCTVNADGTATCRQNCYHGTQPTFAGGKAMYKNAALSCPAGTTCTNTAMIAGANWPGECMP